MFKNIPSKLKIFARAFTILGIVFCAINLIIALWALLFSSGNMTSTYVATIINLILLLFSFWFGGLLVYGFAELIENSHSIVRLSTPKSEVAPLTSNANYHKCPQCGDRQAIDAETCTACGARLL